MRLRRRALAAAGLVVLSLVVHYQALDEWWSELLVPEEGRMVRWQTAGTFASAGSGGPTPQ